MKNIRVLHCGSILDNYYKCINERVAGFSRRFKENPSNTYIYFAVKIGKVSYCGARGLLGELTDYKPWEDADRYVQSYRIENIEYCSPFDLGILNCFGKSWGSIFLLGSKLFKYEEAVNCLEKKFDENICDDMFVFSLDDEKFPYYNIKDDLSQEVEEEQDIEEIIEEKLDIIGTFQTIKFKNEQDKISGLEPLVTEHFYELFQHFNTENSILIPHNRLFVTQGIIDENNQQIIGIRSIPDTLLISYDKYDKKSPIRINLIEYECYRMSKSSSTQKFEYLNGHIIPQLMRFASTFSVVTDQSMREKTVKIWIDKILDFINLDDSLMKKTAQWIQEMNPNIKTRSIDKAFQDELHKSFLSNIKIILIIDELTYEQKDTIKNIIQAFKLSGMNTSARENYIEFGSYIIRLEQKVTINNLESNFALSFQD